MKYFVRILAVVVLAVGTIGCSDKNANLVPLSSVGLETAFANSSSAAKASVDTAIAAMKDGNGLEAVQALIEAAKDTKMTDAELDAMYEAVTMVQQWVSTGGAEAGEKEIMEATDILTSALAKVDATR